MLQFDKMTLGRKARKLGFVRDTFEKVCRLADVLNFIQNDALLSRTLALKGGTAINLTIFELPRLSVDIDMDFSEDVARDEMLDLREQITERISKYMSASGYQLSSKSKTYHALDSFVYEYQNAGGMKDNIKIEINYMLRNHILSPVRRAVNLPWLEQDLSVLSVDPMEIYSSKIVALLNRAAPRDLYDIHTMVQSNLFEDAQTSMLKKCVIFYSAVGSDFVPEQFDFNHIDSVSQQRIKTDLMPVLRHGTWFDAKNAREQVVVYLKEILIPNEQELSFWSSFSRHDYRPELLFQNPDILSRIEHHPMALWKCSSKYSIDNNL
jgi:predicted nucleotidyltransferase component of viral defense system